MGPRSQKQFGFCSGCHEKPQEESELRGDAIRFTSSKYSWLWCMEKKEQRDKLSRQERAGAWTRTAAKEVGNHWIPDSCGGGGAHRTIDGLNLWYEGKKEAKWPE